VLEREPLPRPQPRGRGEQHHRALTWAEPIAERIELVPGVERPLLGVAPLRVLDPELGRVDIQQPPADRAREHLPERLGRLEAMPSRDRHPPGGDRRRAKLAQASLAEGAHRLCEQPAKLLGRLRLALVLGEIHLDELGQRRRLHQPLLAPSLLEHPLERLSRRLLRGETAALHAPRAAPTHPVAVRPSRPLPALPGEGKHLSLLRHRGTSSRRH
jgi:hypothetical protein